MNKDILLSKNQRMLQDTKEILDCKANEVNMLKAEKVNLVNLEGLLEKENI